MNARERDRRIKAAIKLLEGVHLRRGLDDLLQMHIDGIARLVFTSEGVWSPEILRRCETWLANRATTTEQEPKQP